MYALSKSAPVLTFIASRVALALSTSPLLVALSSGVTLSFVTSSVAFLLTELWSVIIWVAKAFTAALLDVVLASCAFSTSIVLAATTMAAMFASVRAGAGAGWLVASGGGVVWAASSFFAHETASMARPSSERTTARRAKRRSGFDICCLLLMRVGSEDPRGF